MIVLKNIQKIYQSGKVQTAALKDISLEVREKEFLMLTGKSGCGKTTLLNILGGMEQASSGEYIFEGTEVSGMNSFQLAAFRNKSIGFVFQAYHLIDGLRAADNVELPLGYGGMKRSERKRKSAENILQSPNPDKTESRYEIYSFSPLVGLCKKLFPQYPRKHKDSKKYCYYSLLMGLYTKIILSDPHSNKKQGL